MRTVKLTAPWTIKALAGALEVPVDEILKRLHAMGAPLTLTQNSTVDPDLGKILGLKYCCYIEMDES